MERSGGIAAAPARQGFAALVRAAIDPATVLAAVRDASAGGNVLFLGTARSMTAGVATRTLEYDAHESLAAATLDALRQTAIARFGLTASAVVHRLGHVPVGEAAVAVATSGPHRAEAFAAAEWLMAEIKRQVPIWKGEDRGGGRIEWQHPESAPRPGGGP